MTHAHGRKTHLVSVRSVLPASDFGDLVGVLFEEDGPASVELVGSLSSLEEDVGPKVGSLRANLSALVLECEVRC